MSLSLKIVVAAGLACAVLFAGATAVVGSAALAGGVARVSIRCAEGPDLRLVVPGVLISAAAATGGRFAGAYDRHDRLLVDLRHTSNVAAAGRITRQVREVLDDLEEMPDAVLVEVEDGGDLVRVVKRGRYLRLRVVDGSGDLDLEVTVPIRTARRTVSYLLG